MEEGERIGEREEHDEDILQIVVKVSGGKVTILCATLSKAVRELKQEPNSKLKLEIGDPHLTFEGKGLRVSDEMRRCGISEKHGADDEQVVHP